MPEVLSLSTSHGRQSEHVTSPSPTHHADLPFTPYAGAVIFGDEDENHNEHDSVTAGNQSELGAPDPRVLRAKFRAIREARNQPQEPLPVPVPILRHHEDSGLRIPRNEVEPLVVDVPPAYSTS